MCNLSNYYAIVTNLWPSILNQVCGHVPGFLKLLLSAECVSVHAWVPLRL